MSSAAPPLHVWPVLAVAVLAVSAAAVIVGGLDHTPPLAIALWRTTFVAVLLAPWVRRVERRDLLLIGLAGLCLAAHFVTWFASLQQTTVLRSTVLVCLGPVWTGLAEWVLQGKPPRRRWWLGVLIAVPAAALMASDSDVDASLLGDALALLGGALGAAYFLIGRSVRQRVGIGTYGSLVCAAAAVALLPTGLAWGVPLVGFSPWVWVAFAALALGPQLLGHNGFNYALRFLPASVVTTATLLEPVGAGILAWIFLGQVPTPLAAVGGIGAIVGVVIAAVPLDASTRWLRRPPAA
jgi:drug/metabolite transporter (DMT)-like permease